MLNSFYAEDGIERCGFILEDETVVEVENISEDPENSFEISAEMLVKFEDTMVAAWHTHPNAPAQLSDDDYVGFMNWPNIKHYIIGADGVRCYEVHEGAVVNVT